MNIQFHIDYQTYYGQDLVLNIITGQHMGLLEAHSTECAHLTATTGRWK